MICAVKCFAQIHEYCNPNFVVIGTLQNIISVKRACSVLAPDLKPNCVYDNSYWIV